MKKIFALLLTAATCSLSSCEKVRGDGPVVSEERPVNSFRRIRSDIDGDLHFTPSARYGLEIRAQQNILGIIDTRVRNGTLDLSFSGNRPVGRHERIDVYVTAPDMNGFSVGGSGNVYVTRALQAGSMDLEVSGSGSITLASLNTGEVRSTVRGSGDITISEGQAEEASFEITGSGSIDALNLTARNAHAYTAGSGTTRLHATDNLDVRITGSGHVIYKGQPRITTDITGSGKVRPW